MPRKQLGITPKQVETIARDVDSLAHDAEASGQPKLAEQYREQARQIRSERGSYRHTGTVKRFDKTGRIKRYKNLATFNRECPTRGGSKALVCELTAMRELVDGSGLATVRVHNMYRDIFKSEDTKRGTWRLHFADYGIMKRHLKGRVTVNENGAPKMLQGVKRKRGR